MIWIKRYRLPLLTLSTVLLFAVFLVRNLISMETLNIKNEQVTFSESANGRWGAFTYDLDIKLQKGDLVYSRTYKRLALSNLFFNLDRVKESDEVSLYMPKSSVSKNLRSKFYYVGGRKTNFRKYY